MRLSRYVVPFCTVLGVIAGWQLAVYLSGVPVYLVPGPGDVLNALATDWPVLFPALLSTLRTTGLALALAFAGGAMLAILFSQSRLLEQAFLPLAVILQVTPVIAIAPLLVIYMGSDGAVLTSAFLVAFFPILANLMTGLKAADAGHRDLFRQLGANRWQRLLALDLPSALPYAMAGLRIGGGLSLIAAVVGEIAAGSAGADAGLAYRLIEAQNRLNTPRLFAALLLLGLVGVALHGATSLVAHFALSRWRRSGTHKP